MYKILICNLISQNICPICLLNWSIYENNKGNTAWAYWRVLISAVREFTAVNVKCNRQRSCIIFVTIPKYIKLEKIYILQ